MQCLNMVLFRWIILHLTYWLPVKLIAIFAESFEHSFLMTNGNTHTLNDSMNVEKSSSLGNRGFGWLQSYLSVLSVRTSFFDIDFVSQIKLTKLPVFEKDFIGFVFFCVHFFLLFLKIEVKAIFFTKSEKLWVVLQNSGFKLVKGIKSIM